MLIAAWLLGALLLFWSLGAYNRLMRLRNGIGAAWQQLEGPLRDTVEAGQRISAAGSAWLPAEGPAFETLRQTSADLAQAVAAVAVKPYLAEPVAQLAVAQALHGSATQRARALLEVHARDSDDGERRALLSQLQLAEQQRDFCRQLFNQRVQAFNAGLAEWPTRALAGLFGFHDAGRF